MSVFYLDSSAWLKRYFYELGSGWMNRLFEKEQLLASSVLGYVEVASALARQQESRKLDEQKLAELREDLEEDWADLSGLPLTDQLVTRAVTLTREYKLRGADAVHLAIALGLKESLTGLNESVVVVTSDRELLEAARQACLWTTQSSKYERSARA